MGILCLLGRHGSGKSTIGAALLPHGFHHTSVGMLRRLARNGQFPSDVPAALMMAMRREQPGTVMRESTARKLIAHASSMPKAVLDGFPAIVEHLALLPADTVFCVIWTPARLRLRRLEIRSESTKRIWTPGQHSAREAALPSLIKAIRQSRPCIFVPNDAARETAVNRLLARLDAR